MKRLEEFVNEKLKIGKVETIFSPKTKEELVQLIIKEIEVNGAECSLNHIDVTLMVIYLIGMFPMLLI